MTSTDNLDSTANIANAKLQTTSVITANGKQRKCRLRTKQETKQYSIWNYEKHRKLLLKC